jgi:hypothetical protein
LGRGNLLRTWCRRITNQQARGAIILRDSPQNCVPISQPRNLTNGTRIAEQVRSAIGQVHHIETVLIRMRLEAVCRQSIECQSSLGIRQCSASSRSAEHSFRGELRSILSIDNEQARKQKKGGRQRRLHECCHLDQILTELSSTCRTMNVGKSLLIPLSRFPLPGKNTMLPACQDSSEQGRMLPCRSGIIFAGADYCWTEP